MRQVKIGMNRPPKSIPRAKKVAPPAVPDSYHQHHRHSSGSSTASITSDGSHGNLSPSSTSSSSDTTDGGFLTPQTPVTTMSIRDDNNSNNMSNSINNKIAPMRMSSGGQPLPTITTPRLSRSSMEPLSPLHPSIVTGPATTAFSFPRGEPLTHKAAVYYHQQLALQEDQGIDLTQSPGRDSPGSSSGSAGSGSRHSTVSLDSGRESTCLTAISSTRGTLNSPHFSTSSGSIGSVDRMNQRSDYEVIAEWLHMLNIDDLLQYPQMFVTAGYDLPTISRMTPEDLTAIGITNPNHREIIKKHIDALQIPDALPNYVPSSIEEWLRLLRLEEYMQPLLNQGYKTVRDVTQLTWEDLEDIGIVKLGHQKKFLLAIKRVKDIISGKVVPCIGGGNTATMIGLQPNLVGHVPILHEDQISSAATYYQHHPMQYHDVHLSTYSTYMIPSQQTQPQFHHPPSQSHQLAINWRRSFDDGDITPTNEIMESNNEGGSTLPRQRSNRQRPVAKVIGNLAIPPPQPLITTDYTIEALKQMSLFQMTEGQPIRRNPPPEPPKRSSNNSIEQITSHLDDCHITTQHYPPHPPGPGLQFQPTNQYPFYQVINNQQNYSTYAGQTHQTTVEVHHVEHSQVESNSSIDSIDNIPFANENAGTIKQRMSNRHDTLPQSASSSSTSSSNSSASTTIPLNAGLRVTSPSSLDHLDDSASASDVDNRAANVLNDIGNMLATLTDELDAMLQEERNAGIEND